MNRNVLETQHPGSTERGADGRRQHRVPVEPQGRAQLQAGEVYLTEGDSQVLPYSAGEEYFRFTLCQVHCSP